MDKLQKDIGEWADDIFKQSTIETCTIHLKREVEEFLQSAYHGRGWDSEEVADCALLLFHIAHKMGFSLETACKNKLYKNKARKWGRPDHQGVVEHIGEEDANN